MAANGFFPSRVNPLENPFYLDLPYDDVNDGAGFARRCEVIPWAGRSPGRCGDQGISFMKNHWVRLTGPNGSTCYGQVEDAGPGQYHDESYVFGSDDARPANQRYGGAGMDVSPALNGCLGFASLDGDADRVSWQFVDDSQVPPGPWTRRVTTSGVHQ